MLWWTTQDLGDDTELIDVVLPREKRLARQHFSKDASDTPNVYFLVILSPGEHDLGGAVESSGHIAGHILFLHTGQAKVANFEIAVFIDENIAWFEIAMDHAGGMDIFEATLSVVERIFS